MLYRIYSILEYVCLFVFLKKSPRTARAVVVAAMLYSNTRSAGAGGGCAASSVAGRASPGSPATPYLRSNLKTE